MKNLFLLKNIINFFSFGKDSIYCLCNIFFKKKNNIKINYNIYNNKYNILLMLKILKIKLSYLIYKKNINNENIIRKKNKSLFKNLKFNFCITNHHFFDYLEYNIINMIKKKYKIFFFNNWYFKLKYSIKPYYKCILKNIKINIIDNSNKLLFNERNFIRCLISKFA